MNKDLRIEEMIDDLMGEMYGEEFDEDEDAIIRIDSAFAEKLADKLNKKIKQFDVIKPKVIAPLEFRHLIFSLLNNYVKDITVLSREEIGCNAQIEVISEI